MQNIISKLRDFLSDECKERGFNSVVFGLSGGVDSAVVAALCSNINTLKSRALIMPSAFTNPKNTNDAIALSTHLGINYDVVSIVNMMQGIAEQLYLDKDEVHRIGNICARLRMIILFDFALKSNSLVVGCSNKSELMLGYGTIYGDLAYSINPIGDVYKSDIFKLAKILGIPDYIVNKKPSADLFVNQSDEEDLGYTYAKIDKLLLDIECGLSKEEMLCKYNDNDFVESIYNRVKKNTFKTELPPIARIKNEIYR